MALCFPYTEERGSPFLKTAVQWRRPLQLNKIVACQNLCNSVFGSYPTYSPYIVLGRNKAIWGKMARIAIHTRAAKTNGQTPRNMVNVGTPVAPLT